MEKGTRYFALVVCLLGILFFLPHNAQAEENEALVPDKDLCAQMIRFGKQSYERGRYLDAKEYFRKAVQADPSSTVAWKHYDLAVIFALAEKVNKDTGLIAPDVSVQAPHKTETVEAPPAPKPAPPKKEEFVIVEDEGC